VDGRSIVTSPTTTIYIVYGNKFGKREAMLLFGFREKAYGVFLEREGFLVLL